jgi:(S)-2-hydroxyglutarate dehydrogenase
VKEQKYFDIAIIGAGVVGVNIAFWLSEVYGCSIVLVEQESGAAFHQSSRNTGGVHRPILLDSRTEVGRMQERSYHLWRTLAEEYNLPWKKIGRITLATEDEDAFLIERYYQWGLSNGVTEEELQLLDGKSITKIEPSVKCVVGLVSKNETITHYGELSQQLLELSLGNGVRFSRYEKVIGIRKREGKFEVELRNTASGDRSSLSCKVLVNAAGGAALRLARMLGLGRGYVDLHLRGAYWMVEGPLVEGIKRNIYPITRHGIEGIDLSYTGPHLITRYHGRGVWKKELGPTAAPVLGPFAYNGISGVTTEDLEKFILDPIGPRKLYLTRDFLSFAWNQWMMVNSRQSVVAYLQKCIPELNAGMISGHGITGVIVEVMNKKGFLSEPVVIDDHSFVSVLYVGGGATASPAFCAGLIANLRRKGLLDGLRERQTQPHQSLWNYAKVSEEF